MTMLLMLMACMAAWALVALMLGDARLVLIDALRGQPVQGGGWMPSGSSARAMVRLAPSRAFTRA
jgi:hypothetical protein